MVSDALVEEVRARADLVEVCGEHTSLRRTGRTHRGPCPLHGGEGPNFSVDPARGIFKCFVCGEGGDVFAFVMKRLGLDFPSAVRHLAERYGIEVPEERERPDPHAPLRGAAAFAEEWFRDHLASRPEGERARAYLAKRGIDPPAAVRFSLGYAPDAWRALRDAARAVGLEDGTLLEAGLLATSERAGEPYDRFRDRIIFPIHDLRDRPIGFGGRALGEPSPEVPKYLNSPESPIFHKGRVLYGLAAARHAIRREEAAILVEGYMDVLSLHLHGIETAVAPLGTALTPEQAGLLGRYAKRVVLLYDSDRAGRRAAFRNGEVLLAVGLHPLIATLPPGEDPDSLTRSGGEPAVRACLDDAVDVLEAKLLELERRGWLGTLEGRRKAVDRVVDTLRATGDPALRDLYFARAAERLGVRRETLVREAARAAPPGPPARRSAAGEPEERPRPAGPAAGKEDGGARAERLTLLLLLRDPSLLSGAAAIGLEPGCFRDPVRRAAFERIRGAAAEEGVAEEGVAGEGVAEEDAAGEDALERLLAELRADDTELVHHEEIFSESARRLLRRPLVERLEEIDREIRDADERQQRELLGEKVRIARQLGETGSWLGFVRRAGPTRSGERAPAG